MISFRLVDNNFHWDKLENIGEQNIFQTRRWIKFLQATQHAEPVIAEIIKDDEILGYFTGCIINKFGLKILGSPFRGWGTYFMGFILRPGTIYRDVLQAFPHFAFRILRCHYLEIIDPNISIEDYRGLPYRVEPLPWFAIDLSPSEEDLFKAMKHTGRNNIRKSLKSGVVIEEAAGNGFAKEYFDQYSSILKLKSLAPTYNLKTVETMIEAFQNSGNILLLRAINSDNVALASGIFLALNSTGVFWGAASWREHQAVRPNDALTWQGIKIMKACGVKVLHMGGECEQYKEKFGCCEVPIFRLMKARNFFLDYFINKIMSQQNSRFKNLALRWLQHG
jgi:hypothetical protein